MGGAILGPADWEGSRLMSGMHGHSLSPVWAAEGMRAETTEFGHLSFEVELGLSTLETLGLDEP